MKNLFDIARAYPSAPEGDGGGSGAGAPPAAGAGAGGGSGSGNNGGASGGGSALGAAGSEKGGEGGAAGDGAAKDPKGGTESGSGAGDQGKPKNGDAPAEFKVTVPDGVKVDPEKLKEFTGWAQKEGFTPELASKALVFHDQMVKGEIAAAEKQEQKWGEELRADKDIGGSNYESSVAAAQKAVLRFGGKELAKAIDSLGLGNYPPLVKAFVKIGKAIGEDTAATETAPKGGDKPLSGKDRLAKRYDHPDSRAAAK